jgi:hypothetical protein
MSRLFHTGFEVGSIQICHEVSGITLTPPGGWIAPHAGDYQAIVSGLDYGVIDLDKVGPAGVATNPLYIRLYIAVSSPLTSTAGFLELLDDADNPHLRFLVDGSVENWDGGAWNTLGDFGSLTSAVGDPSWHMWEFYIDIAAAPDGEVTVRKDGAQIFNITGQTLGGNFGTDFVVHKIAIGNYSGVTLDPGEYIAYDDMAVNDETGTRNNSWPGEGSIAGIRPTANGHYVQYTPHPAGDNYERVNDVVPDDDAGYVEPNALNNTDSYPLELLSGLGLSDLTLVAAVAFQMRVRLPAPGTGNIAGFFRHNSLMDAELTTLSVTETTWHYQTHIQETAPVVGGDWTVGIIDAAQFGFRQK